MNMPVWVMSGSWRQPSHCNSLKIFCLKVFAEKEVSIFRRTFFDTISMLVLFAIAFCFSWNYLQPDLRRHFYVGRRRHCWRAADVDERRGGGWLLPCCPLKWESRRNANSVHYKPELPFIIKPCRQVNVPLLSVGRTQDETKTSITLPLVGAAAARLMVTKTVLAFSPRWIAQQQGHYVKSDITHGHIQYFFSKIIIRDWLKIIITRTDNNY